MTENQLTVVIYSSGLTVSSSATKLAIDRDGTIFTTFYPGGIFGVCSFFVPMISTHPHEFKAGRRVEVLSGIKCIWEGEIDGVVYTSTRAREGLLISCTGYWGSLLNRRRWNKVWCDTRLTKDKWVIDITNPGNDKFKIDRYNRIRITPVETAFTAWVNGAKVVYTIPTGQTIARVAGNYEMHEGTQAWRLQVADITSDLAIIDISSSGTTSFAGTAYAGCTQVGFAFFAAANQTIDYDDGIYGQITDVKIYTESGTPTMSNIVKDIRGHLTDLSSDESLIADNAQVLEPAYMEGQTIAEYLSRLAAYGDTSFNSWAAGVDTSRMAMAGGYKPVIYFEQQPALTDYDYVLGLEDIEGGAAIGVDNSEIRNWIILEYTDINGDRVRITPDDDADLKDTTSIADYGQRDALIRLSGTGITEAKIYAQRYLEKYKNPQVRISGPLVVSGTIRTKANDSVPVAWVRAGKRIMIQNYLQEIGGSELIFLITETRYDEGRDAITIFAGTPDPLEVLAARRRGM